jgi:hypothetical protein
MEASEKAGEALEMTREASEKLGGGLEKHGEASSQLKSPKQAPMDVSDDEQDKALLKLNDDELRVL